MVGTGADLARSRAELLAENALLCQQLLVLRRSVKRSAVTRTNRALLVLLAGRVRAWRTALPIATDTLARLVLQPQELPVGVITAFLGAPFFLGLLVARRHRQAA